METFESASYVPGRHRLSRSLVRSIPTPAFLALVLALWIAPAPPAQAAEAAQNESQATGSSSPASEMTEPRQSLPEERTKTTHHSTRIRGQAIDYTVTAGTIHLRGEDDDPRGSVFYMAYVRDGVASPSRRPVLFSFNGGPGSSSVWLHLGLFGPKRVDMPDPVQPPPPPYRFVANPHSLLDVADLVFIDPVGTGYSKTVGEGKDEDFHGVEEDIDAVGDFIRTWVTRNQRWSSPKLIAGESYGTTRAAGLVDHLQGRGIFVNGVVLVSSILNFQTARFETGNDLPYACFLPTYAATAWYHDALPPEAGKPENLEAFVQEARDFASGEYLTALFAGDKLQDDSRQSIARQLSKFTGLSQEYLLDADLRPTIRGFTKELLRDRRLTVGRLDSRFLGTDRLDTGVRPEFDPSYAAIFGPYAAALNDYVRSELSFEEDDEYVILGGIQNWNWQTENRSGYVNMAESLRATMARDPHLKVFVANGYYDLATPFFATEYTLDHLGRDLAERIEMTYFEAGHMMYIDGPILAELAAGLHRFVNEVSRLESAAGSP